MSSRWEEFYASLAIPTDFEENKNKIKDFCEHVSSQQKIVLVTVINFIYCIYIFEILYVR